MKNYNRLLIDEGIEETFDNVTRFGELVINHSKEFEIHKNKHNVNVFIQKNQFVKNTALDSNFDYTMKLLQDVRNISKKIRSQIDNTNLCFDDDFKQSNDIPDELISLIGSIIENNSSTENVSQSTLTISSMIMYNYKKKSKPPDVSSNEHRLASHQLINHETPIVSYISLKLYSSVRSKTLLQKLHSLGICVSYSRVIELVTIHTLR